MTRQEEPAQGALPFKAPHSILPTPFGRWVSCMLDGENPCPQCQAEPRVSPFMVPMTLFLLGCKPMKRVKIDIVGDSSSWGREGQQWVWTPLPRSEETRRTLPILQNISTNASVPTVADPARRAFLTHSATTRPDSKTEGAPGSAWEPGRKAGLPGEEAAPAKAWRGQ